MHRSLLISETLKYGLSIPPMLLLLLCCVVYFAASCQIPLLLVAPTYLKLVLFLTAFLMDIVPSYVSCVFVSPEWRVPILGVSHLVSLPCPRHVRSTRHTGRIRTPPDGRAAGQRCAGIVFILSALVTYIVCTTCKNHVQPPASYTSKCRFLLGLP